MRVLLLLLLLPVIASAQGISFEKGGWKSVLAKAKKENKLVYMDVYTTWCGPCKVLAKTIFPKKEAGDKYNAAFVNYKVDAEKGEGIALNQKYGVNAYPTHLFIDPKTEEVVYRMEGAPLEVAHFNKDADAALAEWKDPMTWARYEKEFAGGNRSPEFLKAFLQKAKKLDKPNEKILDAYVATLDTKNLPDSTLYFLANNTKTIWSKALPVLEANRSRLEAEDTIRKYYGYAHLVQSIEHPSYQQLLQTKDEQKLTQLVAFIQSNDADDPESSVYYFRKDFYSETKNAVKLKKVEWEEAARILQTNLSTYSDGDAKARKNEEQYVRYKLTTMKLSDTDNVDSIVAWNVARNVDGYPSVLAAETLNGLAWKIYKNKKATATELQDALRWSAKAMELTTPHPAKWAANAGTYASLLYRTGRKAEAIQTEEKALKALREAGEKEDAASYEQTLQKMKTGTF